jgi:DNA-directed RNA polymerase subunit L
MSKINIIIKDIKKNIKYDSHIIFDLTGEDINHILVNTIRRGIMEYIPIYGFNRNDIIIESNNNTSIYDNDEMRLRLSLTPVLGINNDRSTIDSIELLEAESNKIINNDYETDKILNDKKLMEKMNSFIMKINIINDTQKILNVTTNDVTFIYNTKILKESPYKYPLKIIDLKPNEKFICECYSTLNIALYNALYLPCSLCSYTKEDKKHYRFILESIGQINEKEILIRVCLIIIKKLEKINKIIIDKINANISDIKNNDTTSKDIKLISLTDKNGKKKIYDNNKGELIENNKKDINIEDIENIEDLHISTVKGILVIDNESHTMGNLITYYLQKNNIKFAGYKVEALKKELTIIYVTDGTNIINIFNKIFDQSIKLFNHFIQLFETIKM